MTKSTAGLPLTIALQIPTYWTPEQALAVFQLVDELREAIWRVAWGSRRVWVEGRRGGRGWGDPQVDTPLPMTICEAHSESKLLPGLSAYRLFCQQKS